MKGIIDYISFISHFLRERERERVGEREKNERVRQRERERSGEREERGDTLYIK